MAIKKIGNLFVDLEDTKRVLREIFILRHLRNPFIVNLKDVFVTSSFSDDNTLYGMVAGHHLGTLSWISSKQT